MELLVLVRVSIYNFVINIFDLMTGEVEYITICNDVSFLFV